MGFKGQVSSEYLVILSVVVLVALIVVTLIANSNAGSGVSLTQSRNYWGSTSPFVVSEWKYSHKTLELTISNLDSNKLILNEVRIGNSLVSNASVSFNSGESKTVNATTKDSCGDAGGYFELNDVKLVYSKGSISGFSQQGKKPIIGFCGEKDK